jgi:hypothetical protein
MERQRNNCFDQCHAGYRLQFHQLDWQRNRFVLWDEQSGFNYNGRTHHGNSDVHS